jgi:Peptidase family M41
MSSKRARQRLEQTAYHEAGHAVAAYVVRRGVMKVSIAPDDTSLGRVHCQRWGEKFRPDAEVTSRTRARLEAGITVCLAGPEAERAFLGRRTIRGLESSDLHKACNLASYLSGDPDVDGAYVYWLQLCTRSLLARPDNWAGVVALAAALLESPEISGRRSRQIIHEAERKWLDNELAKAGAP